MYLFFDTETNGKPKNYRAPMTDLDNWPRVTQLGWQLYDKQGNKVAEGDVIISPDGWTVPTEKFFIDNNISTERCEREGIPMASALRYFCHALERATHLVAHNMNFDYNVLGAEMFRYGIRGNANTKKICTMESSTEFCALPGPYGYKWPTLEQLHRLLFGEDFDGAHDAMADVKAMARCFFELVGKEVIKP